jgi:hypothetical protein
MNKSLPALALLLASCSPAVSVGGDGSSGEDASRPSSSGTSADGTTSVDPTTSDPEPGSEATDGGAPLTTSVGTSSGFDTSSSSNGDGSSTGADPATVPGACDVWLQDCPPGEKCGAYATDGNSVWNAVGCFPIVPSPDQPGDACQVLGSGVSGVDTCDLGSMCWGPYDGDGDGDVGECVPLCTGTMMEPSCGLGQACAIANEGVLNLCLQSCDPESGDPCPEGEACFPIGDNFVCAPDGNSGPETCDTSTCSPGTVCVVAEAYGPECEATGCCADHCDVSAPECENPGHECVPFFEDDPPAGYEDLGVCIFPI